MLVAMVEMLLRGDAGTPLVIVLAQRSRGAEKGNRAIATIRPSIEVSRPMRTYCIGDALSGQTFVFRVRYMCSR